MYTVRLNVVVDDDEDADEVFDCLLDLASDADFGVEVVDMYVSDDSGLVSRP